MEDKNLLPTFKVLCLGNMGVGKTCIIRRYCTGKYSDVHSTIGVDFMSREIDVDRKRIRINFWDPSGQERFRKAIIKSMYRGVHGIVFVYDVTDLSTLKEIDEWIEECEANGIRLDEIPVLLLGNKCDCKDKIAVTEETASSFAEAHGMIWYETSAKLDNELKIDKIVMSLARILKFSKAVTGSDTIVLNESEQKKKKCCSWRWFPF